MTDGPGVAAIVVAGGRGERFGRDGGKQLVRVAGRPLVCWSLDALDDSASVGLIVVVRPSEGSKGFEDEVLSATSLRSPVVFADSGATRQDSVASGLSAVAEAQLVLVHDGARPLITGDLIDRSVEALVSSQAQGLVVGHPAFDTLKVVSGRDVVETPDRSRFWIAQTPQVFRREALVSAHELARSQNYLGTDDASLVEHAGGSVIMFEGPRENLKVTVPEDAMIVEAVLSSRGGVR